MRNYLTAIYLILNIFFLVNVLTLEKKVGKFLNQKNFTKKFLFFLGK